MFKKRKIGDAIQLIYLAPRNVLDFHTKSIWYWDEVNEPIGSHILHPKLFYYSDSEKGERQC